MYNYEKKYWSKGEYTLRNKDYEGYVGIRKNNGFIFDTNEPLTKNKSFSAQFNSSKNFFDRILDDELSLPHSKKEVQYQNNDFLHKNTLKTIIKNLSENNDYIFKCSTLSNTTIPATDNCLLYSSGNGTSLEKHTLSSQLVNDIVNNNNFNSNGQFDLNKITASDMCVTNVELDEDEDKKVFLLLFFAFQSKIVIVQHVYYPENFDKNTTQLNFDKAFIINKVDVNKTNSIEYLLIKDIKVKNNYLYVVDQKLHMVVRYDIEFLKTSWDQKNNKKNIRVLDILQGEGTIESKAYFKSPCAIDTDDEYIYVADSGNGCIKKYTQSFDFVKTLSNISLADQKFQTLSVNPFSFTISDGTRIPKNSLWVFTTTSNFFYIYIIYDNLMVFSRRIEKVNLMDDEEYKTVKFSFTNSNYYYICTSKRIFKLHLTKPFYPFATISYKRQRIQSLTDIWNTVTYIPWYEAEGKWGAAEATRQSKEEVMINHAFCICGCDEYIKIGDKRKQFDGDIILHVGGIYERTNVNNKFVDKPQQVGFFLYSEPTSYVSSMSNQRFSIYLLEEMENIHHDEYINPQTFNKIIYKLAHNLVNLKNQILGRFWGAYNLDGIMVFDQLEYDDFFQKFQVENIDDLFVHENEPVSIMLNRIFEKIYDVQERLLQHMTAKYRAISAFTNNSIRTI